MIVSCQDVSKHNIVLQVAGAFHMADKPQQQTLSLRIDDALRRRLERARQLTSAKTGEPVSTSEIAKQFLESARDDRLEVSDLLANPTESFLSIRRKGEEGRALSRAEWTAMAHFVRLGVEASSEQTPNPVSRESMIAILDAFLAVHALRTKDESRLDLFYLGNLPPECRPASSKRAARTESLDSEMIRRAVRETRRRLSDPSTTWQPQLAGRNLYVLLDEDALPGGEDLNRVLRAFWPALWRLTARGHYVQTHAPIRDRATERDGLYQPPMPTVTEGPYALSFVRGQGREFSVILGLPGPRGSQYPIIGYPRLVEFRAMLAALVADQRSGDWTGAYFFADLIATDPERASEIWFRAHDNGITFGFTVKEWAALNTLFRRAWNLPEVRRAWGALALEYGEL
jgi:hypothetical protein